MASAYLDVTRRRDQLKRILDRSSDGKLIGDETPEAQRENLTRLDANLDGAIMRDTAVTVARECGHTVETSDPYAMNFNPVGCKHDFTTLADPDFFKYGVEQTKATESKTFAADVVAEQEKLVRADFLILQFPLWWFGLPAILKGWVDRVFAAGLTYGGGLVIRKAIVQGQHQRPDSAILAWQKTEPGLGSFEDEINHRANTRNLRE